MRIRRGTGRGFGPWDIPTLVLGLVVIWGIARNRHFDGFWYWFAWICTALTIVALLRRLFRV